MTQVTVKRLWKEFDGHVVLENVNLHVGDHEFVTIIGASGCGKTTFLKMRTCTRSFSSCGICTK